MKLQIQKGSTSRLIAIYAENKTAGDRSGLTGIDQDVEWHYLREGDSAHSEVGSPVTDYTGTLGTWVSGQFLEVDATDMPGAYEIHVPDACLAGGAEWVVMILYAGTVSGGDEMVPVPIEIVLTNRVPHGQDPHDHRGVVLR